MCVICVLLLLLLLLCRLRVINKCGAWRHAVASMWNLSVDCKGYFRSKQISKLLPVPRSQSIIQQLLQRNASRLRIVCRPLLPLPLPLLLRSRGRRQLCLAVCLLLWKPAKFHLIGMPLPAFLFFFFLFLFPTAFHLYCGRRFEFLLTSRRGAAVKGVGFFFLFIYLFFFFGQRLQQAALPALSIPLHSLRSLWWAPPLLPVEVNFQRQSRQAYAVGERVRVYLHAYIHTYIHVHMYNNNVIMHLHTYTNLLRLLFCFCFFCRLNCCYSCCFCFGGCCCCCCSVWQRWRRRFAVFAMLRGNKECIEYDF